MKAVLLGRKSPEASRTGYTGVTADFGAIFVEDERQSELHILGELDEGDRLRCNAEWI